MSNSLQLSVLLRAVDQATRPFRAVQNAARTLSGEIQGSQEQLKTLEAQAKRIEGFRKTSAQLAITGQALEKAKADAAALAMAFRNTTNPTRAQTKALEEARQKAAELQTQHNRLRLSVQNQRSALRAAGIDTRNLSAAERQLRTNIAGATDTLNRQRAALARVSQQQEKLNAVSKRYEQGKAITAGVRNTGAAAFGLGSAALYAESRLIAPSVEADGHGARIAAQTGGNAADGKQYTRIIKEVNASGVSNDLTQIADAVAAVRSTLGTLGDVGETELARISRKALDMQAALGGEATESIQIAAIMMKNGLAKNSDEAFDLMVSGMQRVSAQMRGELPEILHEYSTHFRNMGFSGSEAMTLLVEMAQQGKFALDKTGDAVKEFSIRGSDMSKASIEAYDAAGLNAAKMSTAIASGGNKARAAMQKTAQGLLKIKDPAERANAAIALFGTPIEDLSIDQIPKFLTALAGAENKLGDVSGAADRMGDTLRDNLEGDIGRLRGAMASLRFNLFNDDDGILRKLTQSATAWLNRVNEWVKANPELARQIVIVAGAATALITVLGGIGLVAWPIMSGINALVAGAGLLSAGFGALSSPLTVIRGAMSGFGRVLMWLFTSPLALLRTGIMFIGSALGVLLSPVGLVVAAIVGGALLIWKYWEPIKAFIGGVVAGFVAASAPIIAAFEPLQPVFTWIGDKIKALFGWFGDLLTPVKSTAAELDGAANMGKRFGEMLAKGLDIATIPMRSLISGVSWLLEKLGLVDEKSKKLPTAENIMPPKEAAALQAGVSNAPTPQGNDAKAIAARYSGVRDNGGGIRLGEFAVVGEHGPEIVEGPVNVTSRKKTAAMASAAMSMSAYRPIAPTVQASPASSPVSIHAPISIVAQPGQSAQDIAQEVTRQLEQRERMARSRAFSQYSYQGGE
ncbi:phage tail tape measure protein [Pectobacterium parmentieri]|uniref:Phage tail tape measure protein n=1 Tax=Pectobacterium parmentieri TaxID=1905730 RepID=A0A8B3F4H1_PECPM|nr:phage tail tape measure protein [Pectobacterium parmentieri]AOR59316.1 phage tail tape measure protein [Pectobacterium parmentieri]AYH09670.1 phage tail tape measure protein [Pectobacterium parmentieri]AYH19621.1 phage tail tape measure protein [Pectobacterium parmentieri]AZS56051.1 phage tail tape measure protein [Pectobacterium parmentieri]RKO75676.1 phage tail tape measure protein [Pectobacterium parmentieri]